MGGGEDTEEDVGLIQRRRVSCSRILAKRGQGEEDAVSGARWISICRGGGGRWRGKRDLRTWGTDLLLQFCCVNYVVVDGFFFGSWEVV